MLGIALILICGSALILLIFPEKKPCRVPSQEFQELVAFAAKLGVTVSVGKLPAEWSRLVLSKGCRGCYYDLQIWCREYSVNTLWHELTHALQDYCPEYEVDAAGLRSLLRKHKLRCLWLAAYILAFNCMFYIAVLQKKYKARCYNVELIAFFCGDTKVGKRLVYNIISSLLEDK
jgi:hypothetical protein